MRVKREYPRAVRELPNVWIPLSDGTRLAARVWLPEDADADPVPAILEYIPYRKNDWTWPRDATMHLYVAGHGYACVRVDLRGSGDSDGILEDEYLPLEHDDALEVIDWLSAQPWCTGAVGMIGISWGGFNALQVAARRPPALKAVITVCSTDDRYADDVHYMGGCVLAVDMLPWASQMLVWQATPPDPEVVGERWRALWRERLERTPPYVEAWLSHQRRDAYWKHGSVCEDYAAIQCAVYAVGGWADGYSDAVFRLLGGLACPRKGLVGPWGHAWPHEATPGPSIGFLQECLRWWDQWLKGVDTGVMDEPMLRVWMQESVPPRLHYEERPGRWVAEAGWPAEGVHELVLHLGVGVLAERSAPPKRLVHSSPQTTGADSGLWCPYGDAADLPTDQRFDDGVSLCFDSAPLGERVELLGAPRVELSLSVDRPSALLAVRLCDVSPDGASTLVTRGLLNLTHRESHERPSALEPGRRYEIGISLNCIAYALPAGHVLRLALSTAYWPFAWPSPEPVTVAVETGASRLVLPIRSPRPSDAELPPFEEPEGAPPIAVERLAEGYASRTVERDLAAGASVLTYAYGNGRVVLPNGIELAERYREAFTIAEGDPLSAEVVTDHAIELGRGPWRTRVEAESSMSCDLDSFVVVNRVDAFEATRRIFSRTWTKRVPRDLV
jgi:putative CocE/NonD family hydrolase